MEAALVRKYLALGIVVALSVLLFIALLPFWSAFFGAVIMYVLFNPLYNQLVSKKWNKSVAAWVVMVVSLLVILVPLALLTGLLVNEVSDISLDRTVLDEKLQFVDELFPSYDVTAAVQEGVAGLGEWSQGAVIVAAQGVTSTLLMLFIMYFILYYMLVNGDALRKLIIDYIPFSKKNSKRLLDEVKNVTNATVISSGVIALED